MKKVAFLGSKKVGLHALTRLIDLQGEGDVTLVGVWTNDRNLSDESSPSISELARREEIDIHDDLDDLLSIETDILISIQYHLILRSRHLDHANECGINLHMAPLPEYRGCNQFTFAILDQKRIFGTTFHIMTPGIDDGAILFERRFEIPAEYSAHQLHQRTEEETFHLIDDHLEDCIAGNYRPIPQADLITERGSSLHYRREIDDVKQIDLQWPADKIDRHVRATCFPPFPPPYAMIDGEKVNLDRNWRLTLERHRRLPSEPNPS